MDGSDGKDSHVYDLRAFTPIEGSQFSDWLVGFGLRILRNDNTALTYSFDLGLITLNDRLWLV